VGIFGGWDDAWRFDHYDILNHYSIFSYIFNGDAMHHANKGIEFKMDACENVQVNGLTTTNCGRERAN